MDVADRLASGVVIPAHPLALDKGGRLDARSQRALTRYYLAAGVDGLAVGVHTTQFELHHDRVMLEEVWRLAAQTAAGIGADPLLIAGLTGDTPAAVAEAELAVDAGYHAALLSPWGMAEMSETALLERARAVGQLLPTIGFYLQESVGGMPLSRHYWRALFELESVVAVKVAPFDRYRTADVARTLLAHDRWDQVGILTGNDDTIIHDLVTPYRCTVNGQPREVRATGGLLGQWAVGTRSAVRLRARAAEAVADGTVPLDLMAQASALVEVNAAVFDVANRFAGCVPGVNEVLRQQGLVPTAEVLGSDALSAGQAALIADVRRHHPELLDEEFVSSHAEEWLS